MSLTKYKMLEPQMFVKEFDIYRTPKLAVKYDGEKQIQSSIPDLKQALSGHLSLAIVG